jgi:hypothetical protein
MITNFILRIIKHRETRLKDPAFAAAAAILKT